MMDSSNEQSPARSILVTSDAARPQPPARATPKRRSATRRETTTADGSAPSLVTGLPATGLGRPPLNLTPKNDNAALPTDGHRAAPGFLAIGDAQLCSAVVVKLASRTVFRPAISRTDVLASSGDAA